MAGCELDFSALPILSGCPGDNETFLVGNAVGGLDVNGLPTIGYARRIWSDIRKCALAKLVFVTYQFVVGVSGMTPGATVLVITDPNIISDSVIVSLGGIVLPRNDATQISYIITYTISNITITFNQAVQNTQEYIVYYCKTT